MRVPSGEEKGLVSTPGPLESWVRAPEATSTDQMSALPAREEKNTSFFPSGDQLGWKSPPGPRVSWRVVPSFRAWTQTFMLPLRSELNAIVVPSGDHAPRLSSRVVAITASGLPAGMPSAGDTGRRQMSAFCL